MVVEKYIKRGAAYKLCGKTVEKLFHKQDNP